MIEVKTIASCRGCEARLAYPRWVGLLLSLLMPGAGIYLAGDKTTGLRWFCALVALGLVSEILVPLPAIPGILACMVTGFSELALTCWMLARWPDTAPRHHRQSHEDLLATSKGGRSSVSVQFRRTISHCQPDAVHHFLFCAMSSALDDLQKLRHLNLWAVPFSGTTTHPPRTVPARRTATRRSQRGR